MAFALRASDTRAVRVHAVLERPLVYEAAQMILAPGARRRLTTLVGDLLATRPAGRLLDVGCGPDSWLVRAGARPVGLDLSTAYVGEFARRGGAGVVGSADALPFASESFDVVFSLGLFHHLPDAVAAIALAECARVRRREGGRLAVLDAVLPRSAWTRPVAHWVRRMDRGRFMRTETQLRALLPSELSWSARRVTYALNGLEMLVCVGETAR